MATSTKQPSDKELLAIYHTGWNDSLSSVEKKSYSNKLCQRAYDLGAIDAIVGDDMFSIDFQTDEQILESIYTNKLSKDSKIPASTSPHLFIIPSSVVFNEDCIEVMKRYNDNYFDLAIVDPPYRINAPNMTMGSNPNRSGRDKRGEIQYGSVSVAQKLKKGRLNGGAGKLKNRNLNTMNCDWDYEKPSAEYFAQLFRVSKNQIIWGGNYFNLPPTRGFIVWNKNQPWDNFSQAEFAWTSFDCPSKLFTYSNRGGGNEEKKIHPTQKPYYLYDYCLKHFANPGDKILDTHLGSGTNRISCYKAGFDFTGIEIDKQYFDASEQLFKQHSAQLRLF